MRIALATVLLAGAVTLAVVGIIPRGRLAPFLAARAPDGQVSARYVSALQTRAVVCSVGLVVAAVVALRIRRDEATDLAASVGPRFDIVLFSIAAIAAAARALLLTRPLHYDEAFTLTEYVWRSPSFFLTRYTHPNNHVLHTLLAWLTTRAGDALWIARLPAFLAGATVVPATYAAARQERTAALLAAALAAGATPLVEFSAQARGYTILILCVLALYALKPGPIAGGLLIGAGAWTIPVMAYAALGYLGWRFLSDRGAALRMAIVAAATTFVLYVPILVISGPASIVANGNVLPMAYAAFFPELGRSMATLAREWSLSFTWMGGLALAALAAAQRRFLLPLITAIGIIAAVLIVSHRVPFPRVWIFLLPLFLVAAGHGLARFVPARMAPFLALAIAAVSAANAVRLTTRPSFYEDPALAHTPSIARSLAETRRPVLVVGPLDAPLAYELRRAGVSDERMLIHRFDTDPEVTRARVAATPHLLAVASHSLDGMRQWSALALRNARRLRDIDGVTLYEVTP